MWTKEELIEIRDRAELEAESDKHNILWRNSCTTLSFAASNLLMLTDRISAGEITALISDTGGYKRLKPRLPIEE
jgi:hypothetical protein